MRQTQAAKHVNLGLPELSTLLRRRLSWRCGLQNMTHALAHHFAPVVPGVSVFAERPDLPALRRESPGPAQPFLALPFDAMRHHYAGAVMAGLVPRSLLASGRLERLLDALETMTLGPLARCR